MKLKVAVININRTVGIQEEEKIPRTINYKGHRNPKCIELVNWNDSCGLNLFVKEVNDVNKKNKTFGNQGAVAKHIPVAYDVIINGEDQKKNNKYKDQLFYELLL